MVEKKGRGQGTIILRIAFAVILVIAVLQYAGIIDFRRVLSGSNLCPEKEGKVYCGQCKAYATSLDNPLAGQCIYCPAGTTCSGELCGETTCIPVGTNPGVVTPDDPLPPLKPVPYVTKSGDSLVAPSAYPGYVYVFTDGAREVEAIGIFIANRGTIVASMPDAGIYVVQVAEGSESAFLSTVYKSRWVESAIPVSPPQIAEIYVHDSGCTSNGELDCGDNHCVITSLGAGRLGGSVVTTEMLVTKAGNLLLKERMMREQLRAGGKNVVISLSLQSALSGELVSEDRTGCLSVECRSVRDAQKNFFLGYLKVLNEEMKKCPSKAKHFMISIAAGNAGVDLDAEIEDLREKYPAAFEHLMIVGGADKNGGIEKDFNHLTYNQGFPPEMIYALSDDVPVSRGNEVVAVCSGTSFSTPEVSAILDYIWRQVPDVTAKDLKSAMFGALGGGLVIPLKNGLTDPDYIRRVVEIAKEKASTTIDFNGAWTGTAIEYLNGPEGSFPAGCNIEQSIRYDITETNGILDGTATVTLTKVTGCSPVMGSETVGKTMSARLTGTASGNTAAFSYDVVDCTATFDEGKMKVDIKTCHSPDLRCTCTAPDSRCPGGVNEKGEPLPGRLETINWWEGTLNATRADEMC